METPPRIIYVLSWKYSDGSAYGIINCYTKKETADALLDVLKIHGDSMKTFIVEPISVVEN